MLKRLLIIESSFNQKCESEALVGEEIKEKAPIDRDILQLLGKTFAKFETLITWRAWRCGCAGGGCGWRAGAGWCGRGARCCAGLTSRRSWAWPPHGARV